MKVNRSNLFLSVNYLFHYFTQIWIRWIHYNVIISSNKTVQNEGVNQTRILRSDMCISKYSDSDHFSQSFAAGKLNHCGI